MIQYDYFDHVNPVTGSTLADRTDEFGYDFLVVGENLAAGQTTPQQAFNDWMRSEAHRGNILDERFTDLGVALRRTSGKPREFRSFDDQLRDQFPADISEVAGSGCGRPKRRDRIKIPRRRAIREGTPRAGSFAAE